MHLLPPTSRWLPTAAILWASLSPACAMKRVPSGYGHVESQVSLIGAGEEPRAVLRMQEIPSVPLCRTESLHWLEGDLDLPDYEITSELTGLGMEGDLLKSLTHYRSLKLEAGRSADEYPPTIVGPDDFPGLRVQMLTDTLGRSEVRRISSQASTQQKLEIARAAILTLQYPPEPIGLGAEWVRVAHVVGPDDSTQDTRTTYRLIKRDVSTTTLTYSSENVHRRPSLLGRTQTNGMIILGSATFDTQLAETSVSTWAGAGGRVLSAWETQTRSCLSPALPSPTPPESAATSGAVLISHPVDRKIVIGALPVATIDLTMQLYSRNFESCVEATMGDNPQEWILKLQVSADGTVGQSSIKSATDTDSPVGACLVEATRRVRFPPLQGKGIAIITYPFVTSDAQQ
jgi:hypothetical protein